MGDGWTEVCGDTDGHAALHYKYACSFHILNVQEITVHSAYL